MTWRSREPGHFRRILLRRLLRSLQYRLRQLAVSVRPNLAQENYWVSQNVLDIYACARQVIATVWLANDWNMLPVAARLAREKGGIYGYDTHEFAVEEYAESLKWRLLQRPMVSAIERQFIGDAAVVSAVSSGIAERLDKLYRLPRIDPNHSQYTAFRGGAVSSDPARPDPGALSRHRRAEPGS